MPRFPLLALSAFVTPVALASAACWPPTHGNTSSSSSSSNNSGGSTPATDPPVIQSLNLNASATNQGAIYEIDGVITFTDDDDVVVAFDVEVPVLGKTYNFPTSDPSMSGYGVPISFTVSSDLPLTSAGPTQFVITLINKSGAASSPVAATVDLL